MKPVSLEPAICPKYPKNFRLKLSDLFYPSAIHEKPLKRPGTGHLIATTLDSVQNRGASAVHQESYQNNHCDGESSVWSAASGTSGRSQTKSSLSENEAEVHLNRILKTVDLEIRSKPCCDTRDAKGSKKKVIAEIVSPRAANQPTNQEQVIGTVQVEIPVHSVAGQSPIEDSSANIILGTKFGPDTILTLGKDEIPVPFLKMKSSQYRIVACLKDQKLLLAICTLILDVRNRFSAQTIMICISLL